LRAPVPAAAGSAKGSSKASQTAVVASDSTLNSAPAASELSAGRRRKMRKKKK
jgi:hypothetical protein